MNIISRIKILPHQGSSLSWQDSDASPLLGMFTSSTWGPAAKDWEEFEPPRCTCQAKPQKHHKELNVKVLWSDKECP